MPSLYRFPLLLATLVGGTSVLVSQAPSVTLNEYQVKAKLLRVLADYTTWPSGSPTNDPKRPFVVGVIGQSPFEGYLDAQFKSEAVKSKTPKVRYFKDVQGVEDVDMLFICGSHMNQLPTILQRTKGHFILTVGDTTGFAQQGVMVNFYQEGDRLRLEVNLRSLQAGQIAVSSHVLKLAKIVD